MMYASKAWLMDIGRGLQAAAGTALVAEYTVVEGVIPVPGAPAHCLGLMIWREQMIPVVDLGVLLGDHDDAEGLRQGVVLAYQRAPGEMPLYGVVLIYGRPAEIEVSDDMAAPLAELPGAFGPIARAAFFWESRAIPILDTHNLFARPPL